MKRCGQLVFLAAVAGAWTLYALTAPDGLPWNGSTHLALAYLGEIVRLPAMPHPVWGFYVQVFGGSVALSVFCAALAAGLLAALVCRYFGWRFAVSAALVWMFLPAVWNRAITGERSVCLVAMGLAALWILNAVMLFATRRARVARRSAPAMVEMGGDVLGAPSAHGEVTKQNRVNRIAGWVALSAAGLFAAVSFTAHDNQYGEAASAFARGVVEDAGKRFIVMNGVCDDQIVNEVKVLDLLPISRRNDDAYRTNLIAWVRAVFPTDQDLRAAARVSSSAFVELATKMFPDRFYLMNGKSTTPDAWERRWEAFKPYLKSSDPFVPVARRMFGYEGNSIANALLDEKAWQLYKRIYEEVDPENFSALVNMSEMIRRGYEVSGDEKKRVQDLLEAFFKDVNNRKRMREIARASGPVRADPKLMEEMAAAAKKRVAAKIAAGEKVEFTPEILSLVEWNNEMVQLMNVGELVKAGRIARAILSNPKWQGFVPANAVMGSVAAAEGDYVAGERFFQVATDTTNQVATVVLNDYADTLMRLGKLDEAEKIARRAIGQSDESFWLARLTLAEVLVKKARGEGEGEIRTLIKVVLKYAPEKVRGRVRNEHRKFVR